MPKWTKWIPGWIAVATAAGVLIGVSESIAATPESLREWRSWMVMSANLGGTVAVTMLLRRYSAVPFLWLAFHNYAVLGILQVIVSYRWIGLGEWNSFGRLVTFSLLLPLPIEGLRNAERIAEQGIGGRVQESWQMTMATIAILSLGHQILRLWDLGAGTHLFLASVWMSAAVSFLYERKVRPTYA